MRSHDEAERRRDGRRPRPPRKRRSAEDRRQQLTESCAYLIATKGYAGTSIREIAAHAGISTSTVLHHFNTKEELLVATLVATSEGFQEHAEDAIEGLDEPVAQLRAIGAAMLESPRHDLGWKVWIAFWQEAALNPRLQPVARARNELWESFVRRIIESGRRDGSLACSDAADAAGDFAALLAGIALHRAGDPRGWSSRRAQGVVDRMIDDWRFHTEPVAAPT